MKRNGKNMPAFPGAEFTDRQLLALRTILAALTGTATLKQVFPKADEDERRAFSRFIHFDGNLDYHRDRKKIALLYGAAYERLQSPSCTLIAQALAPLTQLVFSAGHHRFAEVGPALYDLYGVSDASITDDRLALPGAYWLYRFGDIAGGERTIVKSALLIEDLVVAGRHTLGFKMTYPSTAALAKGAASEPLRVFGIIMPKGRHTYFFGRDEGVMAPYQIVAERPSSRASELFGLFVRLGVADRAVAARLLFIRQGKAGEPGELVYKRIRTDIGVRSAETLLNGELDGLDWAIDNSVGASNDRGTLWQADRGEKLDALKAMAAKGRTLTVARSSTATG